MVVVLFDYYISGYAEWMRRTFLSESWTTLIPIEFLTFDDIGLPMETSDRQVWRLIQERRMFLLTGNRNSDGIDSLVATIKEENFPESLPILTVSRQNDLASSNYRAECITRLVAIAIDLDNFRGVGRLYIP